MDTIEFGQTNRSMDSIEDLNNYQEAKPGSDIDVKVSAAKKITNMLWKKQESV